MTLTNLRVDTPVRSRPGFVASVSPSGSVRSHLAPDTGLSPLVKNHGHLYDLNNNGLMTVMIEKVLLFVFLILGKSF